MPVRSTSSHPRRLAPAAGAPFPVTGTLTAPDGQTYTVTITLNAPVPLPVTDLKIAYLTMGPAAVTGGGSAVVTVVLNKVWPTAVVVALTSADSSVTVPATLTLPAGKDFGTATVTTTAVLAEKLVAISAKYGSSGGSANLRVLPAVLPVPGGSTPLVSAYLNKDGSKVMSPIYGQEIRIRGSGFGTSPGRVTWNGGPVPVVTWSDGEILVRLPFPALPLGGHEWSVTRPDGFSYDGMMPTDMPARLPESAQRR